MNGARGDEQIDTAHYCSGITLAARRPAGWFKSEAIDRWARQGQAGCMNGDDPAARPDQPACRGETKGKGPRGKSERRRVLIAPREKRGGGSTCQHLLLLMATPLICPPPHSPAGLLLNPSWHSHSVRLQQPTDSWCRQNCKSASHFFASFTVFEVDASLGWGVPCDCEMETERQGRAVGRAGVSRSG